MKSSLNNESAAEPEKSAPDEHVTVDNREVWLPKECPKCQRLLKTRAGFEKHTKACTKEPSKPRVILSDEERKARRKAGVQAWVDKNVCIQIRLLRGSDDLAYLNARVEEMQKANPEARIGWATYFIALMKSDQKRHAKKAAKASKK